MKAVLDFLVSTLPWVAIGLFAASSCVLVKARAEGKELSRLFQGLLWSPAACFFFVAIMELYSGNQSSGTTWLVLGAFNIVINFVNTQEEKAK